MNRLLNWLLVLSLTSGALLAQSCNGSKKCGCGTNLNQAYRPKHFR